MGRGSVPEWDLSTDLTHPHGGTINPLCTSGAPYPAGIPGFAGNWALSGVEAGHHAIFLLDTVVCVLDSASDEFLGRIARIFGRTQVHWRPDLSFTYAIRAGEWGERDDR